MGVKDYFWGLEGAREFTSQDDFYTHFENSDHLKFVIYKSDSLTRKNPGKVQRIEGKKFEQVSFSKTLIKSLIFRNCLFVDCQFIGSEIQDCEFHSCQFCSTNTHKIKIRNTYLDPNSFKNCLDVSKHQNIGVHLYQEIMSNSRDQEQIEFERDSQFFFQRWKRYQDIYEFRHLWCVSKRKIRDYALMSKGCMIFRRFIWERFFGCGIRLRNFVMTICISIIFGSVINFIFRDEFGLSAEGKLIDSWIDAIYFTTVSLTTLGYGDISPTTDLGKIFASVQSVIGFTLFAIFASMLFRRVSP